MLARAYFVQGIAVLLWWLAIVSRPEFYRMFAFAGIDKAVFVHFALPDLLLLVGGSFWVAVRRNRGIQWLILGAFLYATLFCLSASIVKGSGYLGTLIMMLGCLFNLHLVFEEKLVRRNTAENLRYVFFKSLFQSAVAWFLTLYLLPVLLVHSTRGWLLPEEIRARQILAGLCFAACGALGLTSSYFMSYRGRGTPLPTDAAQHLVTEGPYARVRNPMAIAGLGQGFAVALFLESWWVAGYVLLGLFVWNSFVRPVEERDLEAFFGEEFLTYKQAVKCWIPRKTSYQKR
ncbi:MAG: methyltransferase family protein [Kiritimatiellia bacterium]